jgi:hypothetical protein
MPVAIPTCNAQQQPSSVFYIKCKVLCADVEYQRIPYQNGGVNTKSMVGIPTGPKMFS